MLRSVTSAEEGIRQLLHGMPIAVSVWDADGTCWYANEPFAQWIGRPGENLVGEPMEEIRNAEEASLFRKEFQRVLGGERLVGIHTRPSNRAGSAPRSERVVQYRIEIAGVPRVVVVVEDFACARRDVRMEGKVTVAQTGPNLPVWIIEPDATIGRLGALILCRAGWKAIALPDFGAARFLDPVDPPAVLVVDQSCWTGGRMEELEELLSRWPAGLVLSGSGLLSELPDEVEMRTGWILAKPYGAEELMNAVEMTKRRNELLQ